jgi:hypothetical protein
VPFATKHNKRIRSLPKKYDMKVTAIEEAHDINNMKVDEHIGSLQIFELVINDRPEKKNKSITFISNIDDDEVQIEMDTDERILDAIVLLS